MQILITYLTIFILFCFLGWCLEVVYRSLRLHHLVNPGFMVGCSLPIYGTGVVVLYAIADLNIGVDNEISSFFIKAIICAFLMTLIEYISGLISLKIYHNRLWDYSNRFLNIQGIVCLRFSIYWAILGGIFIATLYKPLKGFTTYVYQTKDLYLVLGILYGIFIVDWVYSMDLMTKLKKYAEVTHITFNFENLKVSVRERFNKLSQKRISIFNEFKLRHKLFEHVENKDNNLMNETDKASKEN